MYRSALKIFGRSIILSIIFVLAGSAAFLRAENTGNTFATEGLDIKIDNKTWYNGVKQKDLSWKLKDLEPTCDYFFDFDDVKPGDTGTTTISVHIKKTDAWVCLSFKNLKGKENGRNEPEKEVDEDLTGELAEGIEFFSWFDDGDNTFEVGEKPLFGTTTQAASSVMASSTYPLADSKNGPAWKKSTTHYIGLVWCAGDLSVDLATAKISCDASALSNEAQTDSFSVDVTIAAVPKTDKPTFNCFSLGSKKGGGHNDSDNEDNDDDYNPHWSYKKHWWHWWSWNWRGPWRWG